MNSISGFFQKFLNLEKDKNTKIFLILDSIRQETGLELSDKMLEIKGDSVRLKCNPVFRNEIFMHKKEIEGLLRSQKVFLTLI